MDNGTSSTVVKSSPSKKDIDIATQALNHFAQGKRHLLVSDIASAVNSLQEACRLLAEHYGETATECGDAYFYYGKALLELSRIESGVLGNALDGVPEDEDCDNSQVENPENMTEEEKEMVSEIVDEALEENYNETEKMVASQTKLSANADKTSETGSCKADENGNINGDEGGMEVHSSDQNCKEEHDPECAVKNAVETVSTEAQNEVNATVEVGASETQPPEQMECASPQQSDAEVPDKEEEGGEKSTEGGGDEGKVIQDDSEASVPLDGRKSPVAEFVASAGKEKVPDVPSEETDKEATEARGEEGNRSESQSTEESVVMAPVTGEQSSSSECMIEGEISAVLKEEDAGVVEQRTSDEKELSESSVGPAKEETEKVIDETKNLLEKEKNEGSGEEEEDEGEEASDEAEANGEAKDEGEKTEEDEDEVSNLQLAWEMLELAKVIFEKQQQKKEMALKVAQVYLKLGEVSLENENYAQSVEDLKHCLKMQLEHLEPDNRCLAETHYQLGVAYSFSDDFDKAVESFSASAAVIENRICNLRKVKEEKDKWTEEERLKESSQRDDPFYTEQGEIEELEKLLPDIKEKMVDMEEMKKDCKERLQKAKEATFASLLGGKSIKEDKAIGESSTEPVESKKPITDISHLVRKKRKPEEEIHGEDVKKAKSEGSVSEVVNGSTESAQTSA